jgi:hypothetical protein
MQRLSEFNRDGKSRPITARNIPLGLRSLSGQIGSPNAIVLPALELGGPLMRTATWKRRAGESQCGWLLTQQVVRAVMWVLCNCPTYDVWRALLQAAKPNDFESGGQNDCLKISSSIQRL